MTNSRVEAAKLRFAQYVELEELFVTSDGECFTVETTAAAHQQDLTGDRTAYVTITPDHADLYDALNDAASTGDCDTALEDSDLEDAFAQALTDDMKAELTEAARVAAKITEIGVLTDIVALDMLRHGETDSTVLTAITDRLTALD